MKHGPEQETPEPESSRIDGPELDDAGVGASVPLPALLAGLLALAVLAGFLIWRSNRASQDLEQLVIATGAEGGAYHALGMALARLLEDEGLFERVEVLTTQGSVENMGLLSSGDVDLAIVQSDTDAAPEARLLATLFDEALHVLVAHQVENEIRSIEDLDGRRVALGGSGSGTRKVAEAFLRHFELTPSVDLDVAPAEALTMLESGELDVVFMLIAMPAQLVSQVASGDRVRFLSLGSAQEVGNEADAMALVYPQFHATNIPRGTYGRLPVEPVMTVGVTAELIGREGIDKGQIKRLLEVMFAGRAKLDDTDHSLAFGERLRERYEPVNKHLSYHPGAVEFYERHQPSFVVTYAEPISLGLTLLVGLWSASLAFRQWLRRSRKNRIDSYYLEVVRDSPDLATADESQLRDRRVRLLRVRERAFNDLVAERLDANESFSIFQSQVDGELASIERRLGTSASPGSPVSEL